MISTPGALLDQVQRVLIVDDERANRAVLEAMLAPEGHELATVASGEEALSSVSTEPPDLILLDVMMPGMDGYEVARSLKRNPSTHHIPIIMVTALHDRDSRMRALDAGAEDFLNKPVDRAELRARVKNLLRLKALVDYYGSYSEMLERRVELRTSDLAERTRALEVQAIELYRSEQRTKYALDGAHMGVWEVEVESGRMTWSESMSAVMKLAPEQAPATIADFLTLVHPDDQSVVDASIASAVRHGTDFEKEFRVVWPDGSTRWLSGRARMMHDASNKPTLLVGVNADVSERKELEGQLRQAQKMEAVGQLAGGVAHDFNNLLTVIMSYSDLVLHDLPATDEHYNDLKHVMTAAGSAAALTRQLLAFSRKQVMRPTRVDLNELVQAMQEMVHRVIGGAFELVPVLAPGLGAVRADRSQLEQVLMNLMVNARDAMPRGGRIEIATANMNTSEGSFVTLSVCDDGEGMDAAIKDRIFEPFFTTKPLGKGTGLGLATVYGIVKQSGGHIDVVSEPGEGATFRVWLPRSDE